MTYTASDVKEWRQKKGTLTEKLVTEFGEIDTEIDLQKVHTVVLTAGLGTPTAQATTGVDLADGNDTTYYAVFCPPNDITITEMNYLLTEAYKKDTTDAKIELLCPKQGDGFTACTTTLLGTGAVADYVGTVLPETGGADINAGKRLDLKITATDSGGSGTGHAVVMLSYINR